MNAKQIRLGLVSLNQIPLDWRGNTERIRRALSRAGEAEADLVLLPELCVTGYGCEDYFYHPATASRALEYVHELAMEVPDRVVFIGLPFYFEHTLYNVVAVLHGGKVRALIPKTHLAKDGIHYEPRWFHPWPDGLKTTCSLNGEDVPIGVLNLSFRGVSLGVEVCEDAWVKPDKRPCRHLDRPRLILNASASHFSMGKADIRENLVLDSSRNYDCYYAYSNLVGCESGRAVYDGGTMVACKGRMIHQGPHLFLHDVHLEALDLEFAEEAAGGHVDLDLGDGNTAPKREKAGPRLVPQYESREEEFAMAASLALFDYMRKSRSRGFVLSLSGGVDSTVVAVLIWITAGRVLHELSSAERQVALDYFSGLNVDVKTPQELVSQWLLTVYQATANSGSVTRDAASAVAHALGAEHVELDVEPMVRHYTQAVEQAVGRPLTWGRDDIALQNIQARSRGPSVWMLANLRGSLLVSTSNRSEVAVGYATMDGDTCGGLAPIAGVEKTFLRRWLQIMENQGCAGIEPLPVLNCVNQQAPTAELRPPEETQEDEKDLMPYPVLDALERFVIGRRLTPVQAFRQLRKDQHGYKAEKLREWTAKFCRMFAVTQWKRERYAPAFHLDDRSLDPKTWARLPILSGAFQVELEELYRESLE